MKFTDKFVLVPYDRYDRLTKSEGGDTRKHPNGKNSIPKESSIKEEPKNDTKEEVLEIQKKTEKQESPQKEKHFKSTTEENHSNSQSNKIASRPPGILVKTKKAPFKWVTLF